MTKLKNFLVFLLFNILFINFLFINSLQCADSAINNKDLEFNKENYVENKSSNQKNKNIEIEYIFENRSSEILFIIIVYEKDENFVIEKLNKINTKDANIKLLKIKSLGDNKSFNYSNFLDIVIESSYRFKKTILLTFNKEAFSYFYDVCIFAKNMNIKFNNIFFLKYFYIPDNIKEIKNLMNKLKIKILDNKNFFIRIDENSKENLESIKIYEKQIKNCFCKKDSIKYKLLVDKKYLEYTLNYLKPLNRNTEIIEINRNAKNFDENYVILKIKENLLNAIKNHTILILSQNTYHIFYKLCQIMEKENINFEWKLHILCAYQEKPNEKINLKKLKTHFLGSYYATGGGRYMGGLSLIKNCKTFMNVFDHCLYPRIHKNKKKNNINTDYTLIVAHSYYTKQALKKLRKEIKETIKIIELHKDFIFPFDSINYPFYLQDIVLYNELKSVDNNKKNVIITYCGTLLDFYKVYLSLKENNEINYKNFYILPFFDDKPYYPNVKQIPIVLKILKSEPNLKIFPCHDTHDIKNFYDFINKK